jgi:hypothetical protein
MEHIIIVSYPRSGTTVIQRILNRAEGTVVRGETIGSIVHLAEYVKLLEDMRSAVVPLLVPDIPPNSDKNPMYGHDGIDTDLIVDSMRHAIEFGTLSCPQGTFRLGWKENFINPKNLGHQKSVYVLQFIQRLFPNIKFVFNTREPEMMKTSAIWKNKINPVEEILECKSFIESVYGSGVLGAENTTLLEYETWAGGLDYEHGKGDAEYVQRQLAQIGIYVSRDDIREVLDEYLTHLQHL